jgi:hypothetical protein
MFPLVHIYAATEVSKKKTPLIVIGSVLPDVVWVDRKTFSPEKLHDDLDDLYSYLETNQKDMLDLALGMKLHSNKVGADKYSHFYKGGYSYIKGRELIPDLKRIIKSNEDKKLSGLSHNFIEAALDLSLLQDEPDILDLYKSSINEVDLGKISKLISDFSKIDYERLYMAVQMLFGLLSFNNLNSDERIAKEILPKLIKLSFGKDVDSSGVLEVLRNAVEVTKDEYKDLFNEMIFEMKKDFPEFR